jgi:hypothetical protein
VATKPRTQPGGGDSGVNDSETARDLHIWSRRLTGFIKENGGYSGTAVADAKGQGSDIHRSIYRTTNFCRIGKESEGHRRAIGSLKMKL